MLDYQQQRQDIWLNREKWSWKSTLLRRLAAKLPCSNESVIGATRSWGNRKDSTSDFVGCWRKPVAFTTRARV